MDKFEQQRNTNLVAVLTNFGFSPDPNDKRQFKRNGQRISLCQNKFKWFDHSAVRGGAGAIDLVIYINSVNFREACSWLGGVNWDQVVTQCVENNVLELQQSFVPLPNEANLGAIIDYLTLVRGIDAQIISYLVEKGLIFADDFKNCVFIYGDGAELRGTKDIKWNRCYGKLNQAFFIAGRKEGRVVVCESAIDAMSYRALHKGVPVFATAGCSRYNLFPQIIKFSKQHDLKIICAFDNDFEGNKAYLHLCSEYPDIRIGRQLSRKKDWNADIAPILLGQDAA